MATVSTQFIKDILDTLPIGYYLGQRAEIKFSETAATSACNPMDGTIIVSAKNVLEALRDLPDNIDTEEFVRDALYHEVSHLILTPRILRNFSACLNIFEDERIETILAKFYKKVNFKRFVFQMNHWEKNKKPENPTQLFFQICRYRQGPKNFLDRAAFLLEKWAMLNSSSTNWDRPPKNWNLKYNANNYCGSFGVVTYQSDIEEFFRDVCDYWKQQNSPQNNSQKNQDQQGQNGGAGESSSTGEDEEQENVPQNESTDNQEVVDNSDSPENDEDETSDDSNSENPFDETSNSESDQDQPNRDQQDQRVSPTDDDAEGGDGGVVDKEEDSDLEDAIENAEKEQEATENFMPKDLETYVKNVFSTQLSSYIDPAISGPVRRIVTRACKRRKNHTGVLNGYAGKIDARSVGTRLDYRWFQKGGDNGNGKYDRIHLTLWVDKSGSFYRSIRNINCLIRSLNDVVASMPKYFSFDIVAMDDHNKVHSRFEELVSGGGNYFGPDVEELSAKLKRTGWSNYNVVVWDGDLASNRHGSRHGSLRSDYSARWRRAFNVFNNGNTVIVADNSNKPYLLRPCKNARMKLISGCYAEEFIKEVIKLLDYML